MRTKIRLKRCVCCDKLFFTDTNLQAHNSDIIYRRPKDSITCSSRCSKNRRGDK